MREILTVSQLNRTVSGLLERSLPLIWVGGEISNLTRAASGHWYFTLKDAGAQVRAVMFRGRAQYVDFNPREGDKVEVRATVGLYAARGDFQLNVEAMRKAGRMHVAAKHDWSRNIDRYRAVYQELLGRAPSAAA